MFEHFDWADALDWVRVEHLDQQVHKDGVFVESVAFVLFESALEILQTCALLLKNLFTLASLHAKDSHPEELLASVSMCSALKRHPERDPSEHFEQDCTQRPHIIAPRFLRPA